MPIPLNIYNQDGAIMLGYGWAVTTFNGSNLSTADGSGGTFYATIAVYPALDIAFAGFTNCGDGSSALQEVILEMTGLEDDSSLAMAASTATVASASVPEEKAKAWTGLLVAGEFARAAGYILTR